MRPGQTKDTKALAALRDLVASRTAIALVGAGVSARMGYPTWGTLLDALHKRAGGSLDDLDEDARRVVSELADAMPAPRTPPPPDRQAVSRSVRRQEDRLWRAEEYRRVLGDDMGDVLCKVFGNALPVDDTVRHIVRLPFRHIMTTNYDLALERAHEQLGWGAPVPIDWSRRAETLDFLFHFFDDSRGRRYVHLHGVCNVPESLVLTDGDYSTRYVRSDGTVKQLFALFTMQRVVFIGFSLDDPDLAAILRQVNAAAGDEDRPRHFAVMGLEAGDDPEVHRRRFRRKYGVEPVFYEKPDRRDLREDGRRDRHAGLSVLLRELVDCIVPDGAMFQAGDDAPSDAPAAAAPVPAGAAAPPPPMAAAAGAIAEDPGTTPAPIDPADPQKGQWGGLPSRDGRVLAAEVKAITPDWFEVVLTVAAERGAPALAPLDGTVELHLHDTFSDRVVRVDVRDGVASKRLECYGAFTVGARIVEASGETRLELDLAQEEDAPIRFRTS